VDQRAEQTSFNLRRLLSRVSVVCSACTSTWATCSRGACPKLSKVPMLLN